MTARRRLIEVDLARLAPLSLDEQRRRMVRLISGRPRFSLEHMRSQFVDIMNVQPALFADIELAKATAFSEIEKELRRRCKPGDELLHNLACAGLLHSHYTSLGVVSRAYDFGTFPLGLDRGVRFWVGAYYGRDERPVLTFIEPRGGSLGLTCDAREVVYSAMHAGIRERNPDYFDAILQIVQLPYEGKPGARDNGKKVRTIYISELEGEVRYDFEQLDRMFTATLNLWDEVGAEVAADIGKRSGGGPGPLI
jgi:hypothetical protein